MPIRSLRHSSRNISSACCLGSFFFFTGNSSTLIDFYLLTDFFKLFLLRVLLKLSLLSALLVITFLRGLPSLVAKKTKLSARSHLSSSLTFLFLPSFSVKVCSLPNFSITNCLSFFCKSVTVRFCFCAFFFFEDNFTFSLPRSETDADLRFLKDFLLDCESNRFYFYLVGIEFFIFLYGVPNIYKSF